MESFLEGKRVLVLGGWGLVGAAICRELLPQGPAELLVHSLRAGEASEVVGDLRRRFPGSGTRLIALHGDVFLPHDLKDRSRDELMQARATRTRLLDEIYEELTPGILEQSTLFHLLGSHHPHLIVDCINTATAFAYQDLYESVRKVRRLVEDDESSAGAAALAGAVEEQLGVLQLPRLIRHVQILFEAMRRFGTDLYLKIGTTGTGGMGLNVPYTHSEERPSRLLLSKSGLAGAHSMLLLLMGITPGGPVVKEIKPAAAVAWKRIGRGPVLRGGKPIPLFDCPLEGALPPGEALAGEVVSWRPLPGSPILEAAFLDAGENGFFSLEEFETVTALGQMEFITPEEIARHALAEIRGGGTGKDVVSALAGALLGPSYRAGVLRRHALDELEALDSEEAASVAFEMLGPPRLSKLLYEAHLLHRVCRPFLSLLDEEPRRLAAQLLDLLGGQPTLRARILSIGIPILLPDGRLLRGPVLKSPPPRDRSAQPPTDEELERWARAGWVDLRPRNLELWQERLRRIRAALDDAERLSAGAGAHRRRARWEDARPYSPGKLAAWILAEEDGGAR